MPSCRESTSTVYYPGVRSRKQATKVTIRIGEYVENLEIRLPTGDMRRRITGTLQFLDGRPVDRGVVAFTAPEDGYTEAAPVESDGTFVLDVIDGFNGELTGRWFSLEFAVQTCPEVLANSRTRGAFRDVESAPVPIARDGDQSNVTVKLPVPYCSPPPRR